MKRLVAQQAHQLSLWDEPKTEAPLVIEATFLPDDPYEEKRAARRAGKRIPVHNDVSNQAAILKYASRINWQARQIDTLFFNEPVTILVTGEEGWRNLARYGDSVMLAYIRVALNKMEQTR